MSELGVGDELFELDNGVRMLPSSSETSRQLELEAQEKVTRKQKTLEDLEAINALPIVVIRNFASNMGRATREEVLEVLAQWAATLVENHVRFFLLFLFFDHLGVVSRRMLIFCFRLHMSLFSATIGRIRND